MPEYIYLLENRLTPAQKHTLTQVRDAAREAGTTLFLVGGAVRDLTTGSSVRNLDFSVQGNALKLEAGLAARGGALWGRHEPTRSLTFWFPGSVRASIASARTEEYPKPGKPVYHWSTIVEDLRRRDFTANAMALSLNEGSYGLLLDPLNGVADIEARLLRLATNYGFLEDPSRLIRATRLGLRLGWQMEDRTAARYANAKEADAIKGLSPYLRGYELEKIASEEDALDTLKALENEGWMAHLLAGWTSAQADVPALENLRRNWIQLLMQGVTADLTAAHLELLTAKLDLKEIAALKKCMVHPGLLAQWEGLEESSREFGRQLTGKAATSASGTWKLLTTYPAEPILWLAHTRKPGSAADLKFKNFFTVWPEFKKRVPAAMM
ncbi:MAG TPA: CCA tRNA nucleotidyltransferase, partial [Acidobacteriaceae bacterium]